MTGNSSYAAERAAAPEVIASSCFNQSQAIREAIDSLMRAQDRQAACLYVWRGLLARLAAGMDQDAAQIAQAGLRLQATSDAMRDSIAKSNETLAVIHCTNYDYKKEMKPR